MTTPHYLKNNTATIHAIKVDAHRVRFNSAAWERELGKTAVWQQFRSQIPTDSITRGDLFAMAREANAAEQLQVLFLASMVWGYDEKRYGAWRIRGALEAPQLGEHLEMLADKLLSGDLVGAWRAVSIPRVGPAFYSKLFYFLCRGRVQRFPLILDTVLMNAFEQLLGLDVGDYAKVTRNPGMVTSIRAWPEGYQRYVEQMHDWADALDCTADQIELFLFQALQGHRVIRVFLSSTFRDFAEERDLLVKKVFPELRRLCRERQVELVEVDLRWGITEEEAQQGKVLPICLGEIDRARPYFMGFIGDRYGWVPEGSQYPAGIVEREPWLKEHQGGKSVTELEMLHGVLNNPEMAGRAFFYFRDSNYSQGKGGDYLSEDDASAAKLEALKDRIRDSQFPVVEDYADPQALADKVRADLLALIEEEYPANEVVEDLTLERMRHEAYSQARRKLYIGGENYFAQLDAAMTAETPRPVLISGEAGLGKSALIASWLQGWRAEHPKTPVILHHLNATAEADDPIHLVRRLGEEASLITGQPFEAAKGKDEILDHLPSILADLSGHAEREDLSVLIVLDGLERCGAAFEDLGWFPKYVPPRIHLLASCSDGPAQAHLQNFPLEWTRIELEPLSEGQSCDFIERYLKTYRKSLTPAQAARILAHPMSRRPLWLITLLEELRLFGVHEELEARLETLLSDPPGKAEGEAPTIDDLYEHVLARIEKDIDEDYEVAAFKALWASYDGLARSELLELTGMPPAKWAEIQNALDENLFESGGQITFANDFIRKAVEDRHLPTQEHKCAAHRWLGEWFETREVTLDVAQERVHQWLQAGDKDRLRSCLLEEPVFEELYKHGKYARPIGRVALSWITKNLNGVPDEILEKLPEQRMARSDLRSYCRDEGNPVEACLLTIMAWGGMRTDHLRRVWSKRGEWQATLKQLRNTPSISRQDAFRLLSRLRADGCLPGMRAAFFTKLIFFLRYEADGYIMDQWTAKSINLIEGRDVVPIDRTGLVPDRASDHNYEDFCQCIEKVGVEVNQSPDKVEEMLMSRGGHKAGPWRQYVKMHYCR